jgi:hypothetical protein
MRMTRCGAGAVLALAVVCARPIAAQATQPGAHIERLADGVYAIIHAAARARTAMRFPASRS